MKNKTLVLLMGSILLVYGLSFPGFTSNWSIYIIDNIQRSVQTMDSGQLLISSFSYVFRDLITYTILYFSCLLISRAIDWQGRPYLFQLTFVFGVLLQVGLLNQLYDENIALAPHLLLVGLVLFLEIYIPRQRYYYLTFFILLIFVIGAFQWLNLIPLLSNFLFGTDDLAVSIKVADEFLTDGQLTTTLSLVFFLIFFIIAIIFITLVYIYSKQIGMLQKYQKQEMVLEQTRTDLVESKVYQEIHTLVHDLKTPLVAVEGLISLINLKYEQAADQKLRDYLQRVDRSIKKMNEMISEILYEDIKKYITVQELIDYVTSHLPIDDQKVVLSITVEKGLPSIYVNKIRFARAVSNILENAIVAFRGDKGNIDMDIKKANRTIIFRIKDNGLGIKREHLEDIWKEGFSTKNSSGLGLSFVKRVIDNHNGKVIVSSEQGSHTEVIIHLPIKSEKEASDDINH